MHGRVQAPRPGVHGDIVPRHPPSETGCPFISSTTCEIERQGCSNDQLALEAKTRRVGSCSLGAQAYVRAIVPCLDVAWNDSLAALTMSCPSYVYLLTLE
ncbi:hypothetical protein MRX96_027058 [Rhipicephalus microplus]